MNLATRRVKYSEDQERDDHGRFAETGAGDEGGAISDTTASTAVADAADTRPATDAGRNPASPRLEATAQTYTQAAGLPYIPDHTYVGVDVERAELIARLYDEAKDEPNNPEVAAAYQAFKDETLAQFEALRAAGYEIQMHAGEGEPYKNSAAFSEDVRENHSLTILPTTGPNGEITGVSPDNPMLEKTGIVVEYTDGRPYELTYNDAFRWVHDQMGHVMEGNTTGPRGEENAWREHMQMYSTEAARAMTTETRGQNSWVNYGPGNPDGNTPLADREFAPQKVTLLPEWVSTRDAQPPGEYKRESVADLLVSMGYEKIAPIGGVRVKYSEDQERDENGRWTSGGGGADAPTETQPTYMELRADANAAIAQEQGRPTVGTMNMPIGERSAVRTPDGRAGFIQRITEDMDGTPHATVLIGGDVRTPVNVPLMDLNPIDVRSEGVRVYSPSGVATSGSVLVDGMVIDILGGSVRGVLSDAEARGVERTSLAMSPPFNEGQRVVDGSGLVGTLQSIQGDVMYMRLDDGKVSMSTTAGMQHAGTWDTPLHFEAAGVNADGMAREVYTHSSVNDGSARVYSVVYPAEWKENENAPMAMRGFLVDAIPDNHALEADSGLKNAWNGSIVYEVQNPGAIASKDWTCSINIDQQMIADQKDGGSPYWTTKDGEDSRMVMIHELAHGLSNSEATAYTQNVGMEEGVADGYAKAFIAVETYGPDATSIVGAEVSMLNRIPGADASGYPTWVTGLDDGLKNARTGDTNITNAERLDFYRGLIQTPLPERQAAVNALTVPASGYALELTGQGIGTKMGYSEKLVDEAAWERAHPSATLLGTVAGDPVFVEKAAPTKDSVLARIFSAETKEDAEAALVVVQAWLAKHPEDRYTVGFSAEALVMFIRAHEPVPAKARIGQEPSTRFARRRVKYSEDQERDENGRFTSGGGTDTLGPALTGQDDAPLQMSGIEAAMEAQRESDMEARGGLLGAAPTMVEIDARNAELAERQAADLYRDVWKPEASTEERVALIQEHVTPENYRDAWKPDMTPAEGHAWAQAAGTKYDETVVHVTTITAYDAIRGTGFNVSGEQMASPPAHEAGVYFATDPASAQFYEYKGNEAVSAAVVVQNPVEVDWRAPEYMVDNDYARIGEFRAAVLDAAGLAPSDRGGMSQTAFDIVKDSANETTAALKESGFDGVIIRIDSSNVGEVERDPAVGGSQLIVFDKDQAAVIGHERIPGVDVAGFFAHEDYDPKVEEEAIARAFAKAMREVLDEIRGGRFAREASIRSARSAPGRKYSEDQERDDHGRWTDGGGTDTDTAEAAPVGESTADYVERVQAAAAANAAETAEREAAVRVEYERLRSEGATGSVQDVQRLASDNVMMAAAMPVAVTTPESGTGLTEAPVLASAAWEALQSSGGATLDTITGDAPKVGVAIAADGSHEEVFRQETMDQEDIEKYITAHADALAESGKYLGVWAEDGYVHLDVSEVFTGENAAAAAEAAGIERGELAGYNLATDETLSFATGSDPDHPIQTSSVDIAARELAEGKYVDLQQERGLSTLTDRLAELTAEAKALGEKAPLYDLGKVTVQGTNLFMNENLGIPRADMPQFTGTPEPGSPADDAAAFPKDSRGEVDLAAAYIDHLESLGVTVQQQTIPADSLRATQSELDGGKVAGMMNAIESGKLDPAARTIWTTTDDYVLDGHHLWAAQVGTEYTDTSDKALPISSNVIDMSITEALRDAQEWTREMGINPRAVGKSRWGARLKRRPAVRPIGGIRVKYSDDQERDENGRWTSGGGSSDEPAAVSAEATAAPNPGLLEVQAHLPELNEHETQMLFDAQEKYGTTVADLREELDKHLTEEGIKAAAEWYPNAHEIAQGMAASSDGKVTEEQAAAILSVCSARCKWDDPETHEGEVKYTQSMVDFYAAGKTEGLTAAEATLAWKADYKENNDTLALVRGERVGDPVGAAIMNSFSEKAFAVMMGEKTIEEILPENKQRSFYDNIMQPGATNEVTIDVHMMKAYENAYGVSFKDSGNFTGLERNDRNSDDAVNGVGYIQLAEAVRAEAAARGVSPDTIQAAYWLDVQMDPHRETGKDWPR